MAVDYYSGNFRLNLEQMQVNARFFATKMLELGWSLNAICGVLGNAQVESYINPGIWQGLSENPALGYGLLQWTPAEDKILKWATEEGIDPSRMETQIRFINEDNLLPAEYRQYYPDRPNYPETFLEFKVSTRDVGYLAEAFEANYERANAPDIETRRLNAIYWFNYLQGISPSPTKRRKLPLYMMLRRRRIWR